MWPNGVYITVDNLKLAENSGLDVGWLLAAAINGRKWDKHNRRINKIWSERFNTDMMTLEEYHRKIAEERVRALKEDWSPLPQKPV